MWIWTGTITGLVLVGIAAWYLLGRLQPAQVAAQNGVDYHTAIVRRGDIRVSISGTGKLVAYQTVDLAFSTSGTVDILNVKAGDRVTKGQMLAQIDNLTQLDESISNAELQVLQAQKTLTDMQNTADLALAQAYQDWTAAQESLASATLKLQRTAYARCSQETNNRLAQKVDTTATRLKFLSISNTGTDAWIEAKSEYDTAVANYAYCSGYTTDEISAYQAAATVAEQKTHLAESYYQTLKEASGIDPTQLKLDEAALTAAKTQLASAQEARNGATLTAPFDGTVVFVAGQQGSSAGTSTFITIADTSRPTVTVNVDESDLGKLAVGYAAEVTFDALPDITFYGKVVQVDPALSTSGQYSVATGRIELDQEAAQALSAAPLGLNGSVEIIAQSAQNTLLVPLEALRDLGNNHYSVFVAGNDGQLRLRTVEVGVKDTVSAEILSGLQEGDVVSTGLAQSGN